MSKTIPTASHPQYADNVRKLIVELGFLKVALAALGEWEDVEAVEETIQMTRELLRQTERPVYH
jgi:hypothetical protein